MEKILVYLGSDHVIQHPSFGVRENIMNSNFAPLEIPTF